MHYWLIADMHFAPQEHLDRLKRQEQERQHTMWAGLRLIPADDVLIHLGDICVLRDDEIHRQLQSDVPCKRVLVRGNHDLEPMRWYLEHGWHFVCDGFHLEYKRHKLLFTHRPAYPDPQRFTRNIHGHTHGNFQQGHRYGEEYERWYLNGYHVDISPVRKHPTRTC
jgi:calcineurin-like phosphoesterase family protein